MTEGTFQANTLEDFWAKSPSYGQSSGEPLVVHTHNVLSKLLDLTKLRPDMPSLAGNPSLWNILFWAVYFHDWGKAARGFQEALRGGPRWPHRHEVLSVGFLSWVQNALSPEEERLAALAIVSHHKEAADLTQLYPNLDSEDDPLSLLVQELSLKDVLLLRQWMEESLPLVIVKEFSALGVKAPKYLYQPNLSFTNKMRYEIRKHLDDYFKVAGSSISAPPLPLWLGVFLRGCLMEADHLGSAHAGKISAFQTIKIKIVGNWFKHQRKAAKTNGSAILISPTGSGKTEAALLWAFRQAKTYKIPRLFYILPYQASMNAMYDRLNSHFPDQIGLLHGRSLLALYQRLREDEDILAVDQRARWEQNLAKLCHQPIQISSPYQLLKAAFQLKGYEILLNDYTESAFIFDEIHAYEPQRLAMILEFVRFLREQLKAKFFFMSATIPTPIQKRIELALGEPAFIRASRKLFGFFRRHEVKIIQGDLLSNFALQQVMDCFRYGQKVLLVCNTVSRAQSAYKQLKAEEPLANIILIHGRFNGEDRLAKEKQIRTSADVGSRSEPLIVVSTQVVEVSLNIDLDVLFSDPAPIEALLQRFGRINRKRRLSSAPVNVFTELSEGEHVYDKDMVKASLSELVARANGKTIDEASTQDWLDNIYQDEILGKWELEYNRVAAEFKQVFLQAMKPFITQEALAEQFNSLFDGFEVLPKSLVDKYLAEMKINPIEASKYLVPISKRRWMAYERSKLVSSLANMNWPKVVDVPYSAEFGLSPESFDQDS